MTPFFDETDKGSAEYRARYSHLKDLVDSLPVAVFEVDQNANLTFVNHRAIEMFGYVRDDFTEEINALALVSPEDHERAITSISQSLSGDYLGINQYLGIKKDGSTFPVLIHSSPLWENGSIVGIRGTITDISAPSETESLKKTILEIESKFQSLVESVSDWIWEVNTQGQYTFSNQKVKAVLGYEKDEILGRKFSDFMEPEEAAQTSEIFFQHLQSKSAFSGLENENIRKDGTKVLLETSAETIFDRQNNVGG